MQKSETKLFTNEFMIAFLISLLVWSSQNLIQTVVPLYLSEKMGSSLTEIGVIISISTFSTIILRPFLGYVVDRGGRRLVLLISTFSFSLLSVAYLLAKTPAAIGWIRLIQGIPFAASTTALGAIASDLIPVEKRGEGLSYFTLTNTLAIAIGPSVGVALYFSDWPALPFIVSAIVLLVCFIASFLLKIPYVQPTRKRFSLATMFDRKTIWFVISGALAFFGIPGIMTYSTIYSASLGIKNITLAYAMYGVGLVTTRILTARAIDKYGAQRMGTLAMLILMLGFGFIGLVPNLVGLFIGSVISSIGIGIITPTLFTMAVDVVDMNSRGLCTAMIYAGFDLGMAIGSLFFGWVADSSGSYAVAYSSYGIIALVGFFVFRYFAAPYYERIKITDPQSIVD